MATVILDSDPKQQASMRVDDEGYLLVKVVDATGTPIQQNPGTGEAPTIVEVEKIVEVVKEVQVPVEVEKRVEVPVYIDREVEVIKEVEKPVEVIKEVEVVREVEKVVEVPTEVEKIVEVVKEVEKVVEVEKLVEVPVRVEVIKEVEVPGPSQIITVPGPATLEGKTTDEVRTAVDNIKGTAQYGSLYSYMLQTNDVNLNGVPPDQSLNLVRTSSPELNKAVYQLLAMQNDPVLTGKDPATIVNAMSGLDEVTLKFIQDHLNVQNPPPPVFIEVPATTGTGQDTGGSGSGTETPSTPGGGQTVTTPVAMVNHADFLQAVLVNSTGTNMGNVRVWEPDANDNRGVQFNGTSGMGGGSALVTGTYLKYDKWLPWWFSSPARPGYQWWFESAFFKRINPWYVLVEMTANTVKYPFVWVRNLEVWVLWKGNNRWENVVRTRGMTLESSWVEYFNTGIGDSAEYTWLGYPQDQKASRVGYNLGGEYGGVACRVNTGGWPSWNVVHGAAGAYEFPEDSVDRIAGIMIRVQCRIAPESAGAKVGLQLGADLKVHGRNVADMNAWPIERGNDPVEFYPGLGTSRIQLLRDEWTDYFFAPVLKPDGTHRDLYDINRAMTWGTLQNSIFEDNYVPITSLDLTA